VELYDKFFVPFPIIKTERLTLRKMRRGDVDDLYDYCRREESCRYSNWTAHQSKAVTKEYIRWMQGRYFFREGLTFVVEYEGRVIGTASFADFDEDYKTVEIGYGINSDYWGKGIGREIVSALLEFAFNTIGVIRVYARVMPENERSAKLLAGLGFTLEGVLRKSTYIKNSYHDVAVYSILDDEYANIGK